MDESPDANAMHLVRTTVETEAQAQAMARRLVESKVACCVHVSPIQSTFSWDGTTVSESEWLVEARAPRALGEDCWVAMQKNHPYDVPLVEMLGESRVNGAYARWAQDVTAME